MTWRLGIAAVMAVGLPALLNLNWKFMVSVVATIALVILAVQPWNDRCLDEAQASYLFAFVTSCIGTCIGACIYGGLRRTRLARKHLGWALRPIASMLSGFVSLVVGVGVGLLVICPMWDSLVFRPHPSLYSGDLVYQGILVFRDLRSGH